jgi:hypothetical protein
MDDITFVDYGRPALPTGDYQITATQTIALDPAPFTVTRRFTVSGERFALPPTHLTAMFPPDGSLGDHHNVLPHVMLGRPTLPWERSPGAVTGPWLVLLLFAETERPAPSVIRLGDLAAGPAYHPAVTLESHQSPDDQATVIDVPRRVLEHLLPASEDLPYLAHLRRTEGAEDTAVVIGNRLPPAGVPSTVHLVSVEGRYQTGGFDLGPGGPDSLVRLVTLANWRFASLDGNQSFAALARDLAQNGSPYRLPDSGNADGDRFLRQGYVPMRHTLRQGGSTVSWYRGPFATGPVTETELSATRTSDHLLRFQPDVGMFDTAYAAAWELGRLLALQSTAFATDLYEWKRRRSQKQLRSALEPDTGYPLQIMAIDDALPGTVLGWLTQLSRLNGVPLAYLVPDERLLPVESIRFVQVDRQWIRHLLDGAFSIGRLSAADAELDRTFAAVPLAPVATGALIRSDLVAGYPGLLIDGYASTDQSRPLALARMERLTPSILLCLFDGVLARLDIHQQPESLHFAVELPAEGSFGKSLRDSTGAPGPSTSPLPIGPGGRLPIAVLAAAMATALGVPALGSGDFARQMIEAAERVSFLRDL